jgi:hypothetical protein
MTTPTKADIAAIARKLWGHNEAERREGRGTVAAVLAAYQARLHRRAQRHARSNRPLNGHGHW